MIHWNLAEIAAQMDAHGITNRKQLAERAAISLPTAYALFDRQRLRRVDVPTLEALTRAFGLDAPWALLDYVPNDS